MFVKNLKKSGGRQPFGLPTSIENSLVHFITTRAWIPASAEERKKARATNS